MNASVEKSAAEQALGFPSSSWHPAGDASSVVRAGSAAQTAGVQALLHAPRRSAARSQGRQTAFSLNQQASGSPSAPAVWDRAQPSASPSFT